MMGGYGATGMMSGYGFSPIGGILTAILLGPRHQWHRAVGRVACAQRRSRPVAHRIRANRRSRYLKTRYAKGEITKEQFESIKRDLET